MRWSVDVKEVQKVDSSLSRWGVFSKFKGRSGVEERLNSQPEGRLLTQRLWSSGYDARFTRERSRVRSPLTVLLLSISSFLSFKSLINSLDTSNCLSLLIIIIISLIKKESKQTRSSTTIWSFKNWKNLHLYFIKTKFKEWFLPSDTCNKVLISQIWWLTKM